MSQSEQSIITARASVMVYDETSKKWLPSGGSSGLSRVHIYQNTLNNTFRIVGRKLQDHELVINCAILKSLKYNQATLTFHNWRDSRQVYGLNFSTKEDAQNFAETMTQVLDILNASPSPSSGGVNIIPTSMINSQMMSTNSNNMINNHGKQQSNMGQQMPSTPPLPPAQQQASIPPQPVYGHTGCPPPEYSEVWTVNTGNPPNSIHNSNWTNSDMSDWKQAQLNEINSSNHHHHNHSANQNINHILSNVPVPPSQATYGVHKPTSTPNPGMINLSQAGQVQSPIQPGQQQMQPQAMYLTSRPENTMSAPIPPPPPPPPPIGGLNSNVASNPPPLLSGGGGPVVANSNPNNSSNNIKSPHQVSNLASALSNVKLKKASGRDDNCSDTTSKSSSSGSLGMGMGMASMMDEMNRTLARRRALAEGNNNDTNDSTGGNEKQGNWNNKMNRNSPNKDSNETNAQRLRTGSLDISTMNGIDQLKIDQLKQEILSEIRKEITKMKSEIIDAIKLELRSYA